MRLADAVALAAVQLADWGYAGCARAIDEVVEPLNAGSLALNPYESGRPTAEEACRIGDARLLEALGR